MSGNTEQMEANHLPVATAPTTLPQFQPARGTAGCKVFVSTPDPKQPPVTPPGPKDPPVEPPKPGEPPVHPPGPDGPPIEPPDPGKPPIKPPGPDDAPVMKLCHWTEELYCSHGSPDMGPEPGARGLSVSLLAPRAA